jgi:hypothetical protein
MHVTNETIVDFITLNALKVFDDNFESGYDVGH